MAARVSVPMEPDMNMSLDPIDADTTVRMRLDAERVSGAAAVPGIEPPN